jgi:RNA recognition motif-containing protein
MAQKLFVGGLSFSTTSDGLREFFSQSGTVVSASVVTDQFSGQSRGFGFVEMQSAEDGARAVQQLNGRELDGRQLRVEVSQPKAAGARPGGGNRGGGRGGWR